MHTLLRTLLLTSSLAVGIAFALVLALRPAPSAATRKTSIVVAPPAALATALPSVAHGQANVSAAPAFATPLSPVSAPVVAPYRDPVAKQVGQLEETLQQLEETSQRRERSMLRAIENLQNQLDTTPAPATSAAAIAQAPAPPVTPVAPPTGQAPQPSSSDVRKSEGDDSLDINIQNTDIRQVLERLSQEAGLNILASKNVTGVVTANLSGVSVETALAAILKSTGLVAQREGSIIYVGLPSDLALMSQSQDTVRTKVYRPNYIRAADLQALIVPMLTPNVGKVTVSAPSEVDIPSDKNKSGGNSFTGTDVVVVRDYEAMLVEVDQLFEEVDIKPRQVAIEAMILSVKLSDSYKLGVSFDALRDSNNARLISGTPITNLDQISLTDGGLKFGFVDASLALFIDALEKVGDTNVIAAPRLTCLNKQRAEIQIGEELGYISTTVTESSATQTVNFLDVGTLLRIRPHISNDGLIRLEVHPELSTGSVQIQQGLSLPQKSVTQVTTNVLCPDGCTVVIGGLIREDLTTTTGQIPFLGALPYVGFVFRQKIETIDRNEIIVVITPRIVSEPFMCKEGTKYGNEFTQRQSIYFDKMSPIGRRNLAQHHLRMARAAFNASDYDTAMKQVNLAIHYDPVSRPAIALRNEVVGAGGFAEESIHEYLKYGLAPLTGRHRDYSRQGAWWKEFEGFGEPEISGVDDRGVSGPVRTFVRPEPISPSFSDHPRNPSTLEALPPAAAVTPPAMKTAPTAAKPNPGANLP